MLTLFMDGHLECLPRGVHCDGPAPVEEPHGETARGSAGHEGRKVAVAPQQAPEHAAHQLEEKIGGAGHMFMTSRY